MCTMSTLKEVETVMTATAMHDTVIQLQNHVKYYMVRQHNVDEWDLVDDFLEALDLDESEQLAILEEYRLRKRVQR